MMRDANQATAAATVVKASPSGALANQSAMKSPIPRQQPQFRSNN